jgi:SAM-dependent methyltransferase
MTTDAYVHLHQGSTTWARVFPHLYEPTLWLGERAGVRALRKRLVRRAFGDTLEIGAGTGLNLPHYPDDVDELILAEPDPGMFSRLERKTSRSKRVSRAVLAPAERLPVPDASVDTVVSTFVLCTVEDPEVVLRELRRVLRPGGQLLFLEHVRSESPRLARWQDRLAEPWRRFGRGCRCNRTTGERITASGFVLKDVTTATWRVMPPIVQPLIAGSAEPIRLPLTDTEWSA